jgi:hypothetical protein
VVLFLYASNAKVVVVFYRAAKTMMTRLHATHNWGKKGYES